MAAMTFQYRPKMLKSFLTLALFAGLGAFFVYKAQTWDPNTGMIINGVMELSPSQAPMLWWVFAGLSLALFAFGALGLGHRLLNSDKQLELTDDHLQIPGTLFGSTKQIPWAAIAELRLQDIRGTKLLTLRTADGTKAVIHNQFLTDEDFDTVVGEVTSRQAAAGDS